MKSAKGEILYIGKAASIKKRVLTHFRGNQSVKNAYFLGKVSDIDCIVCSSQEQALILEASLIKENQPKYNVNLKDDKSYPYAVITKEKYSRIWVTRPNEIKNGICFGPFTNSKQLQAALKLIRTVFPYRSCKRMSGRPCLYYHLNLCPAPCAGKIGVSEYRENIGNVSKIISGERKKLIRKLEQLMNNLSKKMMFEEAARVRDKLIAISSLYSGENTDSELIVLKRLLNLKKIPFIIEAIDISSLTGKEAAGSVAAFKNGIPDKDNYRRYRIKTVDEIDDYKMIAEVVRRRYCHLKKERKKNPDLIIIDGGKGHVKVAKRELEKIGLKVPVIGIAKRNEEIWFPKKRYPLIIPKDNPALHLIQKIRDEAHRFAHKYHTLLREKRALGSGLRKYKMQSAKQINM